MQKTNCDVFKLTAFFMLFQPWPHGDFFIPLRALMSCAHV